VRPAVLVTAPPACRCGADPVMDHGPQPLPKEVAGLGSAAKGASPKLAPHVRPTPAERGLCDCDPQRPQNVDSVIVIPNDRRTWTL